MKNFIEEAVSCLFFVLLPALLVLSLPVIAIFLIIEKAKEKERRSRMYYSEEIVTEYQKLRCLMHRNEHVKKNETGVFYYIDRNDVPKRWIYIQTYTSVGKEENRKEWVEVLVNGEWVKEKDRWWRYFVGNARKRRLQRFE